jgi:hypothetical protein
VTAPPNAVAATIDGEWIDQRNSNKNAANSKLRFETKKLKDLVLFFLVTY